MAAVPYLNPGDSVAAAHWNAMFEELDRKIAAVMNNRALPYMAAVAGSMNLTEILGQPYFFRGATDCPYSEGFFNTTVGFGNVTNYDHTVYTNAVAAATFATTQVPYYDVTNKVVMINSATSIDKSLEAHRKNFTPPGGSLDSYWVFDIAGCAQPQRIYKWAMADFVVENYGATLTVPNNWNKYNFFRIHNVQNIALQVDFHGPSGVAFSHTIPKYQSICIRRESTSTGYTVGYKYFQKFLPGDLRWVWVGNNDGTSAIPVRSCQGNNVVDPFVLSRFLGLFTDLALDMPKPLAKSWTSPLGGVARVNGRGPRLFLDPKYSYDAGALYQPKFPAIDNAKPIGDYLYHTGKLLQITSTSSALDVPVGQEITFSGFGTFAADMAAAGITVGTDAQGQPTITKAAAGALKYDILPLSTNLTVQTGVPKSFALAGGFAIYGLPPTNGGNCVVSPWDATVTARSLSYTDETGTVHTPSVDDGALASKPVTAPNIQIHNDTLGQMLLFNKIGNAAYAAGNQNTAFATFTNRAAMLSPFGLIMTADLEVSLGYQAAEVYTDVAEVGEPNRASVWYAGLASFSGNKIVFPVRVSWSGYWPQADSRGWFFPLRYPRLADPFKTLLKTTWPMLRAASVKGHSSVDHEVYGPNGVDMKCDKLADVEQTPFQILSKFSAPTAAGDTGGFKPQQSVRMFRNEDSLYKAWKNYLTAGWWHANRGLVFANDVTMVDQTIYWRFPLTVENFNALASMVNAIKYALPLNFVDNALLKDNGGNYNTFRPDYQGVTTSLGAQQLVAPVESYCALLTAGKQAQATWAGIPIKLWADVPDLANVTAITSTARKNVGFNVTVTGPLGSQISTFNNFTLDNGSNFTLHECIGMAPTNNGTVQTANYKWCKIEDVKAYAEANDWLFIFEDMVPGYKLEVYEPTSVSVEVAGMNPQPNTRNPSIKAQQASFICLLPPANVEDVRWVSPHDFAIAKAPSSSNNDQAPQIAAISPNEYVLVVDSAIELEDPICRWGTAAVTTSDYFYGRINGLADEIRGRITKGEAIGNAFYACTRRNDSPNPAWEGRRILFRNFNSDGLPRLSKAVLIPRSWFVAESEGYVSATLAKAKNVCDRGASAYPLTDYEVPATPGSWLDDLACVVDVCGVDEDDNPVEMQFVEPSDEGTVKAFRVFHFRDCLIRL